MANRKRNIQIKFWVTEEEKQLIEEKMAQLQTKRIGAYLRKMAIDGYIIQVDTTDIKEMTRALSAIGRNINQIAKRLTPAVRPTRPTWRRSGRGWTRYTQCPAALGRRPPCPRTCGASSHH